MANWYCDHVAWSAVTIWAATTAYSIGDIRRQTAAFGTLTVGNERVFRCTTAGTSGAAEPTWVLTHGATTSDGTVVWTEITGQEAFMGTTWACPHARLSNAFAAGWGAAGDWFFVASEATADTRAANLTLTSPGTSANPCKIICVTKTKNALPPAQADITTGAAILTTSGGIITLNASFDYYYGLNFSVSSTANLVICGSNMNAGYVLDNVTLTVPNGLLAMGPNGTSTSEAISARLSNATINFGNAGNSIVARAGNFEWLGGALTGTVPTQLFGQPNDQASTIDVRDVDVNSAGTWTSKFLVNLTSIGGGPTRIKLTNCKLATTLGALTTGTISQRGLVEFDVVCTDSTSNVLVREEHYRYEGSMVQDTTNYRNGGASDGTTPKSWKVITLSTVQYEFPFECPDIFQWVDSAGLKTVTLYIGSGGTLKDNDVGFELEYKGSATSPLGTYTTTFPGILAAGSNLATDSISTWAGSAATTLQVVTATVTINAKGWVRVRPIIAKPSTTVYIDPLISVM